MSWCRQLNLASALLQLFIINRSSLNELSTGLTGKMFSAFNALVNSRFVNSLSNSISNISAHYDVGLVAAELCRRSTRD